MSLVDDWKFTPKPLTEKKGPTNLSSRFRVGLVGQKSGTQVLQGPMSDFKAEGLGFRGRKTRDVYRHGFQGLEFVVRMLGMFEPAIAQ